LHFRQSVSAFSKNGQKKCPKLKTEKTFGKRKSLKYNKFSKQLKETRPFIQKYNYQNNM